MWPAGFSNLIAARAFRGKATTPTGSSKSRNDCGAKKSLRANAKRLCNVNSSGLACRPKPVMLKVRRASIHTKNYCDRKQKRDARISRFIFHLDRVWEML